MDVADVTIDAPDARALTDADVLAINRVQNALRAEAFPDDPPTPPEVTAGTWRNLPAHEETRIWFAREAGEVVALALTDWEPEAPDNRHLLWFGIRVLPSHRRRGLARRFLAELVSCADALGRTLFMFGTHDRVAAGGAFAQRIGATIGQEQRGSRLLIGELDRAMLDAWIADGPRRAEGYELIFVDGDIPDELMDGALATYTIMNTAPRDDLQLEDWEVTADHIRAWERMRAASGGRLWTIFVRHRVSGELVGFTEIGWNPKVPGIIQQMGTAVDPAHRGHALGKWLKADMLVRLLDSDVGAREVRTGNAESNDAMLGINVALGFRPFVAEQAWQIEVEQVRRYLHR